MKIVFLLAAALVLSSCHEIKKMDCDRMVIIETERYTNDILDKIKQENIFMDKIGWRNLTPEQSAIYDHNINLSIDIIKIHLKYLNR